MEFGDGRQYILQYTNTLVAALSIMGRKELWPHISLCPTRPTDSSGNHVYDEMWIGNHWWQMQTEIPAGAAVLSIIGGSNATNLGAYGIATQAWPVYLSLGNVARKVREQLTAEAFIVVGYIPKMYQPPKRQLKAGERKAKRRLWHNCMEIIMHPLIKSLKE